MKQSACESTTVDDGLLSMNRWVDESSARALTWLILVHRSCCSSIRESSNVSDDKSGACQGGRKISLISCIPEDILVNRVSSFLHFDEPVPGMIYIFGGRASKVLEPEHYLETAECFDTFRKEWISLPPMSTKRVGAASVVSRSGLVYIFGGYSKHPDKPLASGECFNPRTGEWMPIAPMSRSRFGHTAQEYEKYIFVVGGDSRRNLVTEIERYDTELDTWETVGLLPRPVAGGRILARDGKLYLVGGDIGSQPLSFTDTIRVYDPVVNSWSTLEQKLEMGRSACAVTWCGEDSSEIAVIGGYAAENDTFFELKTSELIETAGSGESKNRRIIPPMPEARAGCRAVTIGAKIYVIGGETPDHTPSNQFPDSTLNLVDNPLLSSLFDNGPPSSSRPPLINARDILLQALQQRLNLSVTDMMRGSGNQGQTRISTTNSNERKPHPSVAVFDTEKWEWESDTPSMTIARTAASVCVGPGFSHSYGWNTGPRWITERSRSSSSIRLGECRPQAASG